MIWGAIVGGLLGTVVLTTVLRTASELGWTRMDLPFLLGTAVTSDRVRAKAAGYVLHFAFGIVFALAYAAVFAVIGRSGFLLGALLGLVHGLSPDRARRRPAPRRPPTHGHRLRRRRLITPARAARFHAAQLRPADAAGDARLPRRLRRDRRWVHSAVG